MVLWAPARPAHVHPAQVVVGQQVADSNWLKRYWATCSDDQQSPLKPACVPGSKHKLLNHILYDVACRRAWLR